MSAPSNYQLIYPVPCEVEGKCGQIDCPGVQYNARPQEFCQDVKIDMNCTIQGNLSVVPAAITVGGQTFTPTVINTISGPHLVLAVY